MKKIRAFYILKYSFFVIFILLKNEFVTSEECYYPRMKKDMINYDSLWQSSYYETEPNILLTKYNYPQSSIKSFGFSYAHYNKKVDFKRNIHIFLKDRIIWDWYYFSWFHSCEINYGITLIFSKNPSSEYQLYNLGPKLLIEGLKGIIAVTFQIRLNKISIYNCLENSCNISNPTKSVYFFYTSFFLNFHIIYDYSNQEINVYSGDPSVKSNLIINYNKVNIANYFLNGEGYIGFTATDYKCGYFNDLSGSFICADGGTKIAPEITLMSGEVTIHPGEKLSISPSTKVILNVIFRSPEERTMMGAGSLIIDNEDNSDKLNPSGETGYKAIFYSSTKAGVQMNIIYKTFYDIFIFILEIKSSEVTLLEFYYGKNENENKCYFDFEDYRILQYGLLKDFYGTGCGGNFELLEFEESGYLYFYVRAFDQYGNLANINSLDLISFTKLNAIFSGGPAKVTVDKEKEYIYKIGVEVRYKGTYTVTSPFFDKTIVFIVKNLVPSNKNSFCNLEKSREYIYKSKEKVKYTCIFYDKEGMEINIETSKEEIGIEFYSKINRIFKEEKLTFEADSSEFSNNSVSYTFLPSYNGKYEFIVSAKISRTSQVKLSDFYDIFYVSPIPNSFASSKFYNYKDKKWIDEASLINEIFIYNEEDSLFAIQLVDIEDPQKTPFANMSYGYSNFDINLIKGTLEEKHSNFSKEISFDYTVIDGKTYILAKINNSKNEFRRTSFYYYITLMLNKESAELKFKVELKKIGNYIACRKKISPKDSILNLKENSLIAYAGETANIGELILRTDCESEHLFNYFLEDDSKINFIALNNQNKTCKECSFPFKRSQTIDGIYELQFISKKAGEYIVISHINEEKLKDGFDTYQIKVKPLNFAFYLLKTSGETESECSVNIAQNFTFIIKDKFENNINYALNSSGLNNNLGLIYSLIINEIDYTNIIKNTDYLMFLKEENHYVIKDSFTKMGNYKLIIGTIYSDSKLEFSYYKKPGFPSAQNSKITVINSDKLLLDQQSIIQIDIYDSYNNYIGADKDCLISQINIISAYAESEKYPSIEYDEREINENSYLFKSPSFSKTGIFYVSGKINDDLIKNCISCKFEVIDPGYSFKNSQLKIINEKPTIMTEDSYYTLYEGFHRPGFEFLFLTLEGSPSTNIAHNIGIIAELCDSEKGDATKLEKKWIGSNRIFWSLPIDYILEEGKMYILKIKNDEEIITEKRYFLMVSSFDSDSCKEKEFELKNTLVSPNILYLFAGKSEQFIIEFKCSNGLRYNEKLETKHLLVSIPDDLKEYIQVQKKIGVKNGQFIIDVISKKSFSYTDNYKLKISYKNESLENQVKIITYPGELEYFKIDSSCFVNEEMNILNPGTTDFIPKIKLIPYDKYNNRITEYFSDSRIYPEESFSYLFNMFHKDGNIAQLISSINPVSFYIDLNPSSKKVGMFTLSSKFLRSNYTIEVKAGAASTQSIGYIKDGESSTISGKEKIFVICPRDQYGNKLNESKVNQSVDEFKIRIFNTQGILLEQPKIKYNNETKLLECLINTEKTGKKVIKAFINDKEILLSNNIIDVINSNICLNNTKIIYLSEEYKINDQNLIEVKLSSFPYFEVNFFDVNENLIKNPSIYEVEFSLEVNNNQLISYYYNNTNIRLYINESQIYNFLSIQSEEKYYLILKNGKEKNSIGIKFIDKAPNLDFQEPVSFESPEFIEITSGEKSIISLKFYTEGGSLMGYFFDEPSSKIQVSCLEDYILNYTIIYGESFGKYNLLIYAEKSTNIPKICTISSLGINKKFSLKVNSNIPIYCEDTNTKDELIAFSGEKFEYRLFCYDQFNNVANVNPNEFSYLIENDNSFGVFSSIISNSDNSLLFTIYPTLAGTYKISSSLFSESIIFITLPGKISEENSYLEVQENAKAGDTVDIFIHCLDKFNNPIKINSSETKIEEYFDLYTRYKISISEFSDYEKVIRKPELIIKDNKTMIKYEFSITKSGINEFRAIFKDTSSIIACKNCELFASYEAIDIFSSEIFNYDSFSESYKIILEKNNILYNFNQKLLIRIYPKDKNGNLVPAKYINNLLVFLSELRFFENRTSDEYLEFEENGTLFSTLKGGEYKLIIKINECEREIPITLSGSPSEEFFSDNEIDIYKTLLISSSLDFLVGQFGYFNFEIRNKNNIRHKGEISNKISLNSNDETLDYIIINKKSSNIIVLVFSSKANTFPKKNETYINVLIDDISVLSLEMFIHPGDLHSAKVKNIYLNEDKEYYLKTISVDELLKFSILGYDIYKNQVQISADLIKLTLLKEKEEFLCLLNNNNVITGEQIYIFKLEKAGKYIIEAGKNSKEQNLFDNNYIAELEPGEIDPEMSIIKINDNSIIAGTAASASIIPKDKNNNSIEITKVLKTFKVYLKINNQKIPVTNFTKEGNEINYKIELTKSGQYSWDFYLNEEKINCFGCSTIVRPSKCKPGNTIIYSRDRNGLYKRYIEGNNIYSHIDSPLSIHLLFRDEYENIIEIVNKDEIFVSNGSLSGNCMKEKLLWSAKVNSDSTQYYLDLNKSIDDNKYIFEHLVERTEKNAYRFNFTVKEVTSQEIKEFNLFIDHYTKKDDTIYGNGDYSLKKSNISEEEIEFKAGKWYKIILKLVTEEGLLYNGEIDISSLIDCSKLFPSNYEDSSFKCNVEQKKENFGIYFIKYYSEKVNYLNEKIKNQIYLRNPENNNMELFRNVQLIVKNGDPFKEKTVIIQTLPKKVDKNNKAVIYYQLFDIFGNLYKNQDNIIDFLNFYNHGMKIIHKTQLINESVYQSEIYPQYPPKEISIQLVYQENEENPIELFPNLQTSIFDYSVDINKTIVSSKNGNKMQSGELLNIEITLFDEKDQCYLGDFNINYLLAEVKGPLEGEIQSFFYGFNKEINKELFCELFYNIDINDNNKYTKAGTYSIIIYVGEKNYVAETYLQTLTPGPIDANNFIVFYEKSSTSYIRTEFQAGEIINFYIQACDSYNNTINYAPIEHFEIDLLEINGNPVSNEYYSIKISPYEKGLLECSLKMTKSGKYNLVYKYKDKIIHPDLSKGPSNITYISGPCNINYPKVEYPEDEITNLANKYEYNITCYDEFNNPVNKGGAKFSAEIFLIENQIKIDIEPTIQDNKDGTYQIFFIPPLLGEYSLFTYLNNDKYSEKIFNLTEKSCSEEEYLCPNQDLCVKDLRECIPEEYRCFSEEERIKKPFRCTVKGEEKCVESMNDCDFDTDKYYRCGYMNILVPIERQDMCAYFLVLPCSSIYKYYKAYCQADGICRRSRDYQPNHRVCPIGTVLCPDLTCAKSIEQCYIYPECPSGMKERCNDQTCVSDREDCPSTITCNRVSDVVCPDGTCVENEIYCPRLKICSPEIPYLCSDNSCAKTPENCPKVNSCGHGKSLCSDLICREEC